MPRIETPINFKSGTLVKSSISGTYDFMIWVDQDLNVDSPLNTYGRVWMTTDGTIGLIIKTGLSCHAVLYGEHAVIIPANWCETV